MPAQPGDPGHFDNEGYYRILNSASLNLHCRRRGIRYWSNMLKDEKVAALVARDQQEEADYNRSASA